MVVITSIGGTKGGTPVDVKSADAIGVIIIYRTVAEGTAIFFIGLISVPINAVPIMSIVTIVILDVLVQEAKQILELSTTVDAVFPVVETVVIGNLGGAREISGTADRGKHVVGSNEVAIVH